MWCRSWLIAILMAEFYPAHRRIVVSGFHAMSQARMIGKTRAHHNDHLTQNDSSHRKFPRMVKNCINSNLRSLDSPIVLFDSKGNNDDNNDRNNMPNEVSRNQPPSWLARVSSDPKRTLIFSLLMTICGAALGPFLDSYHSAFGVLQYDDPITATLWGTASKPALTTTWWVPALFGLAGFIIGWLYILLDALLIQSRDDQRTKPSPPRILVGISMFTLQYWLSGILYASIVDRTTILNVMSIIAFIGFYALDGTFPGFITSAATAICGPLIEAGLLSASIAGYLPSGYHYNDPGETGFFPLWILPVYFLGGPAVGNLARGFWDRLSQTYEKDRVGTANRQPCSVCNGTRRDTCPNCDGIGTYTAMGGRSVTCTSCKGRGYVICRACFNQYNEDPNDIEAIRDLMSRMPD